jgi:hypothetical protein
MTRSVWPGDARPFFFGMRVHQRSVHDGEKGIEESNSAIWHSIEDAGHSIAVGATDDILAVAAEELQS